jgi:hypothetical protein
MALQMVAMEVHFYLTVEGREMPVFAPTQFLFPKDKYPETVEELTDLATNWINKQLNDRSVYTITLESANHSKVVQKAEDIRSVFIPAPDALPEYQLVTLDGDEDEDE